MNYLEIMSKEYGFMYYWMDGDVPARSAMSYVDELEGWLSEINESSQRDYQIASGGGRMLVTMDRYGAEWGMVEQGWHTHVFGKWAAVLICSSRYCVCL